jgi:tetratricopeptide (TPR) repeat protein
VEPEPEPELTPVQSTDQFAPRVVAVLPLRDFTLTDDALFLDASSTAFRAQAREARAVEEAITTHLHEDARFRALRLDAIQTGLERRYRALTGLKVVKERYLFGRSLYEEMRLEAAIDALRQAERMAHENFADLVSPDLMADIYLVLGLAEAELGRADLAHISFKRMFLVDPTRTVPRGYYPEPVQAAFIGARRDLRESSKADLFDVLPRVERLLAASEADDALFSYIEQVDGRRVLRFGVYSRATRSIYAREEVVLGDAGGSAEGGTEAIGRAVSRWFACTPAQLQSNGATARSANHGKFYIDTSGTYGVYLAVPTRELFHNVGFVVNAAYNAAPNLDLFGKITILTAFADPRQDLTDGSLTSLRFVFGAGVALERGIWRGFIRPGIELHYVGPFTVVTNPTCKFWGLDDERCPRTGYRDLDGALLGGVNLGTGFTVSVAKGVYIATQANISLYFPLLEQTELNYLFNAEFGIGYSF